MFLAVSCDEENPEETRTYLEYGFTDGEGELHSGYYCGYKSAVKEFDKNNATITFYYGNIYSSNQLKAYPDVENILFYVYFINGLHKYSEYAGQYDFENDPYLSLIKVIDDFFAGQYKVNRVKYGEIDGIDLYKSVYNHSEIISIPEEAFMGESGILGFNIIEYRIYNNGTEPEFRNGASAHIYYKTSGDKVVLSEKPFEN